MGSPVKARTVDAHAEKWKSRFSYTKSGLFRGYLPGSGFRKAAGNTIGPPAKFGKAVKTESTHDKEIRELMEIAITKKDRASTDPLLPEKAYFLKPSGFETRGIAPVARNVMWYCHKAWSMMRQGHRDEAIRRYEGALKLNPRHVRSLFNAGVLHEEIGEHSQAEECFTEIVERGNAGRIVEAYAYFNRGINAQHRRDYAAALQDYNEAIERIPGNADFYYNRGMCARALGLFPLAAADIEAHRRWQHSADEVEDTLQALFMHASSESGGNKKWLSKGMKRQCRAWLERARQRIAERVEAILAKPIHERDAEDETTLFKTFGYYPAIRRAGTEERVRALCKRIVLGRFEKGESIARKRKVLKHMYIVLSGSALMVGSKDVRMGMTTAKAGAELCAEVFAHRNAESEMTVIAESELVVAVVSRADFDAVQSGCLTNDMETRRKFLSTLAMFQHYSDEKLHELASMCVHQVFPYEQLVIEQEEESQGLYMVLSGTVKLEKDFEVPDTVYSFKDREWQETGQQDGGTLSLGLLYPGGFFGEASITETTSVGRSPTRVVSMGNPVECLLLPRNCRMICDEKVVYYLKLLKATNPNDSQIQEHREYEKYWDKYKKDCIHLYVHLK